MARAETTIEIDESSTRTGVRGRLDKLMREFAVKAQALKMTIEILDADDRQQAQLAAPKKFLQAINHRNNGHTPPVSRAKRASTSKRPRAERLADVTNYLQQHPGADTFEIAAALGWRKNQVLKFAHMVADKQEPLENLGPLRWTLSDKKVKSKTRQTDTKRGTARKHSSDKWYDRPVIQGKALTLFVLEHLMDNTEQPIQKLMDELATAGSPIKSVRYLNGPIASVANAGFVKKVRDGYRRTATGAKRMVELREMLEAKGKVKPGGYVP